jgi:predicted alpha-1,2-mannosidase
VQIFINNAKDYLCIKITIMPFRLLILTMLFSFNAFAQKDSTPTSKLTSNNAQFVNPFIGTGGHGHTYPGSTVPFGMVQLSPDTRIDGSWDGCSGYHYSDSLIYGFSHTHLNGTGCSDYGDISIMPSNQIVNYTPTSYAAKFNHKNESALAGYYQVKLDNGIRAEFTSSKRVGMHNYHFAPGDKQQIVIDLEHRDKALDYFMKVVNDSTIEGYRISEAWAKKQEIYFYIVFNQNMGLKKWLIHDSIKPTSVIKNGNITGGHFAKLLLTFNNLKHGELLMKVAISSVSSEGAKNNMLVEIPHWNFDKVKREAFDVWNQELAKIEIADASLNQKKIFYTALYHCMVQPNIYNDVDGKYRGRDAKIHKAEGFDYYSVFSLWDTFRAWHPLMTIIDRKRTLDFIKTFLAQYDQGGLLPVWELSCNETECMIGYHSVSVIADAVSKGIVDFDAAKALEAMKKSAESKQRYGLGAYMDNGALAIEDESESVSKTLEYAYDDWCIAQVAKYLNIDTDYQNYMKRSQSWKNLFDHETKFIRPKKNGDFLNPFDPYEVNNNYTEANAWQYTFFVPHDIAGLTAAYGGEKGFENKLDSLFNAKTKTSGREQADITGLIGQYAHGNEPSHHIAYLYHTIGKQTKTADKIHQILNDFYKNEPDGLIGNEDCGQMSAWYVLSALGMYQICPGNPQYEFSTPLFKQSILKLENNKKFLITNLSKNKGEKYIKKLNANFDCKSMQIPYGALIHGGSLSYQTTNITDSAYQYYNRNYALVDSSLLIITNPLIKALHNPFIKETQISMHSRPGSDVYYTLDGSFPTLESKLYQAPFVITQSTLIKAFATSKGNASKTVIANVHQLPHPDWKVNLKSVYNKQYTAGGDNGLIDGLFGSIDWRKGGWQGYQSQDFEVVLDLTSERAIKNIAANFLQDSRSWILMPKSVSFEYSIDGKKFIRIDEINNEVAALDNNLLIKTFIKEFIPVKARYVRIKATNYGKLPIGHQGAGGDAFIFIDEISIN